MDERLMNEEELELIKELIDIQMRFHDLRNLVETTKFTAEETEELLETVKSINSGLALTVETFAQTLGER